MVPRRRLVIYLSEYGKGVRIDWIRKINQAQLTHYLSVLETKKTTCERLKCYKIFSKLYL